MLLFITAIIIGLMVLVWSADRFVSGAVATALNLGMTPIMVGLTVVAFGTSAPELIVSATAAFEDSGSLAVGNAIGSNIANIALVLGLTALVSAIPVKDSILQLEFPILIVATGLATYFVWDAALDISDGIALLLILFVALVALAKLQSKTVDDFEELEEGEQLSPGKAYAWLAFSILLLLGSSQALVWGASGIARELGVSELVIGLTIVAIGTSLPELAASIASALKGHHDLALGNIVGSNLFNLLAVLALPALINPLTLDPASLRQDYGLMLALTAGLAIWAYGVRLAGKHHLGKIFGTILFVGYLGYLTLLYQQSLGV
ncbi:MAG: calcium/sodium antiporter [Oleiphilus sp.]|nr:MAG: calcium/sodium antiporter [Oleiphilus sp.]